MQNSTPIQHEVDGVVIGGSLTTIDQLNLQGLTNDVAVELMNTAGSALTDFQVQLQMTDDGEWFPLFVAADWASGPVGAMLAWVSSNNPAALTAGNNSAFILTGLMGVFAVRLQGVSAGSTTVTMKSRRVQSV
jgi:hypothetical protein